jgi:hypothetical protein
MVCSSYSLVTSTDFPAGRRIGGLMARVTVEYRIKGPVPFVDVLLDTDNELFIDPSVLRNHGGDALKKRAHGLVMSFFAEVLRCRTSVGAVDIAKGESLLKRLHEPNETRFGLSENQVQGHGFGDQLATRLWNTLATNPACAAAVLTQLEDVPLFIDKVGDDLISDLTTRVTFEVLADFTSQMMGTYPALNRSVTTATSPVWNSATRRWDDDVPIDLPYVEGHQLLLVPKNWIFWRLMMTSEQFYNRHSTRTIQEEQTAYDSQGKALKPSKKGIIKQNPDRKALNNKQAVKYKDDGLIDDYRSWVDAEYEPMTDDQIEYRLD